MNGTKSNSIIGYVAVGFAIVLEICLIVVTAIHTLNLIEITLPAQWALIGWAGLGAVDAGLILWTALFMYGARGKAQRAISIIMLCADFIGVATCLFIDMFLQASRKGAVVYDPAVTTAAIIIVGILIMANLGTFILFHITSPTYAKQRQEEELKDAVEQETLNVLKQKVPALASQLSVHVANDIMDDMETRVLAKLQIGQRQVRPLPAPKVKPLPVKQIALEPAEELEGEYIDDYEEIAPAPAPADGGTPVNFTRRPKPRK